MVRTPAIAAGVLWFAVAQGACGIRGLAFGLSSLSFSFGAILIGSRVLAVSEVMVGFVMTSSLSFAHLSSFAFVVFAFAFVRVGVGECGRVVAQFFLSIG